MLITHSFCQNNSTRFSNEEYLKKSNHQKTAALILLPVGMLSTGIGMVRFKNEDGSYGNSRNTVFLVTGLAALGGSINLFIASSRNKKKGKSISFGNKTVPQLGENSFSSRIVPCLTLKIIL